ncbi:hypothetical protein COLO4_37504 [Corchorus olitorius]|uniref:Uncharacterized protein n=1 Tax=Corchorus olitorius TaxID=93759 RepID=A0A1R3G160_9ROSI|nr:hypothetical protein COLO4_37504 [Corchorus olitorius]
MPDEHHEIKTLDSESLDLKADLSGASWGSGSFVWSTSGSILTKPSPDLGRGGECEPICSFSPANGALATLDAAATIVQFSSESRERR